MRKLAILGIIIFTLLVVTITLGATNYAGFGDWLGAQTDGATAPFSNWVFEQWVIIGTSGWFILAETLVVSVVGGLFWVFIAYGLVWQKLIKPKVFKQTQQQAPVTGGFQNQPSQTIPITGLQNTPTQKTEPPKVVDETT